MDERMYNESHRARAAGDPEIDREAAEDTGGGPPSLQALQEQVERLTREAERNWQQFLQTAADLENYRKHAVRQREEAVATARRTMLAVVLGVLDTLDRAVLHTRSREDTGGDAPAPETITYGLELARRTVLDTLATMRVRPMEVLDRPFDPRLHEAVEAVPAPHGVAPGTVVGEVQRGYLIGEDVLRPARVRVAQ
jgi:molecular chaperone GrpE